MSIYLGPVLIYASGAGSNIKCPPKKIRDEEKRGFHGNRDILGFTTNQKYTETSWDEDNLHWECAVREVESRS